MICRGRHTRIPGEPEIKADFTGLSGGGEGGRTEYTLYGCVGSDRVHVFFAWRQINYVIIRKKILPCVLVTNETMQTESRCCKYTQPSRGRRETFLNTRHPFTCEFARQISSGRQCRLISKTSSETSPRGPRKLLDLIYKSFIRIYVRRIVCMLPNLYAGTMTVIVYFLFFIFYCPFVPCRVPLVFTLYTYIRRIYYTFYW